MIYALDTSIIVDVLSKKKAVTAQFNQVISNRAGIVIPSAVDYEVVRGFYYNPSLKKEHLYQDMRMNCPVIEVNAAVWRRAAYIWATLRKVGLTIDDADILISATCIERQYTLVTHNTKHFENINGLLIEDWI